MDTENQLVAAAVAGDRDAFSELVRQHRRAVHDLAVILTGGDAEAEDLVQETFIRAFLAICRFRGDSRFKTWLHRIAVNVIRTHQSRRIRQSTMRIRPRGADGSDPFDALDSGEDLEATVLLRYLLEQALITLPPKSREMIVLRDVHGFDYRQIADLTGIPIGTVESRIFRARRKLRPLLSTTCTADARACV